MNRRMLEDAYDSLLYKFDIKCSAATSVEKLIKEELGAFVKVHKNVAIYCYGEHTEQLMRKFIFELRNVKYIIDNNKKYTSDSGYIFIGDGDIEKYGIDGVIISTYKYKEDIANNMSKHLGIAVFDIYEMLKNNGVSADKEFYRMDTPYTIYKHINKLQRFITSKDCDEEQKSEIYWELISEYIRIKDFKTAISKCKEYESINSHERALALSENLECIYKYELEAASEIADSNVLMFCFDGMRNEDISEELMPKLNLLLDRKSKRFSNAYSYSTSTFESLVPAYSENTDQKTFYFEKSYISSDECRFINEAKKQQRKICFYDGGLYYIKDDGIKYSGKDQTVTEKLWDFILDAIDEKNGLFYLHEEDESHFSYVNPYTKNELMADGLNILFDFLEKNGGFLRADYEKQHKDALKYLDDVVSPILQNLNCAIVLYADHGNLLYETDRKLSDIRETDFSASNQLVHIPFAILSKNTTPKKCEDLFSLLSINDVLIALLKEEKYENHKYIYVKIGRSGIYNPDFRLIYQMADKMDELLAFEGFIIENKWKLIVFKNGRMKLYDNKNEASVYDKDLRNKLFLQIKDEITVCEEVFKE